MTNTTSRMRQVVDWSAVRWAGLISGAVFLVLNMILTQIAVGSAWIVPRILASVVMGPSVLPPPATFDLVIFLVALVVHLALSMVFAAILDIIIHRWGLIVGLVGGALFGLALYGINFYTMSYFFPWFYGFRSWMMIVSHIVFGMLAGGIYELMEVEEFVPVED